MSLEKKQRSMGWEGKKITRFVIYGQICHSSIKDIICFQQTKKEISICKAHPKYITYFRQSP
jgi:hypothetical protein